MTTSRPGTLVAEINRPLHQETLGNLYRFLARSETGDRFRRSSHGGRLRVRACHAESLPWEPDVVGQRCKRNLRIPTDLSAIAEPDDRILTSRTAYVSNHIACLQVADRTGAAVAVGPHDEHGQIDVDALRNMIDEDMALIALPHVPTNGGLVNPAAEVGAVAIQTALRERHINVPVSTPSPTRLDAEARNLPDLVRASVHYHNTENEIVRFESALRDTLAS